MNHKLNQQLSPKAAFMAKHLPPQLTPSDAGEAYAPSNIALSKYWGKRDVALNLPTNGSLSISLGHLGTHTRVTLSDDGRDHVYLNGQEQQVSQAFARKFMAFCHLFRREQSIPLAVYTDNTIPTAAGLASSASGFAALTLALNQFFSLQLPESTLSAIARLGSGSASRSLWHGFVHWQKGTLADGSDSIAYPMQTTWPEFRIALLEVDTNSKKVSSRDGMTHTANTSPLFSAWPTQAERDLIIIQDAIMAQDFKTLGETAQANALAMHATMLAARPYLSYFQPQTLDLLDKVQRLQADGVEVYVTIDAGPNVKVIFLADDTDSVNAMLNPNTIIAPFHSDHDVN